MRKKIIIYFIPFVFEFLESKVRDINHALLRQGIRQIIADARQTAELMQEQDLSDAATAQAAYDKQLSFSFAKNEDFRAFIAENNAPHVTIDKDDVIPVYNDLPTPLKKRLSKTKKNA